MTIISSYIAAHKDRFLSEYFDMLRVPSIAAQGKGIHKAAAMVRQRLEQLGAHDAHLIDLPGGSPVVYGTIGSGAKRLLIYDHYDVQPPEPYELWKTSPFEPTIRDDKVFARGASDNKGTLMMRIHAIETWLATRGELPLTLVFVVEGEEEIGSPHLESFCRDNANLLAADGCLWETGKIDVNGHPIVDCGAKGMLYVEFIAHGANADQHSSLAPILPNPAWQLVWALATLKGQDERVLIDGFYDSVRPPTESDRDVLAMLPHHDEQMLSAYGLTGFLAGVQGADMWQQLLFSPTCTICGMHAGYTGDGTKTVLPAEARAKIDFRLVPDMEPDIVLAQLQQHLAQHGFGDTIEVVVHSKVMPARSPLDDPLVRAVARSGEAVYGKAAIHYPMMAGTGPMYMLCQALGTPVCSGAGASYFGERIHAPNENIRLQDYWNGMRWMIQLIEEFATSS